jgi:hypothetical protein
MDMRRSGTLEVIAGGAEGLGLVAKMANSIDHFNALHRTYASVDEVAVQNVDEARWRGRRKLCVLEGKTANSTITGRVSKPTNT